MPVITVEVMSGRPTPPHARPSPPHASPSPPHASPSPPHDAEPNTLYLISQAGGMPDSENSDDSKEENPKARCDLLEYMVRSDGSVVCRLCGEVLQSRTYWYRHKYKRHVVQPLNPSPLFQCEQCLVFFKSRKGYIGHLASRHNGDVTDPVATRSECDAAPAPPVPEPPEVKIEPDPDWPTPNPTQPNQQLKHSNNKTTESRKSSRTNKDHRSKEDWEEKRFQEEKLVADIIDRVKRECEAQGSGGGERRGYTRRTTVMHT